MTWWRRRLRPRALDDELDAELRDHIEREIADGVRTGESEADVRRRIRLTSGGLDQVKEACRDVRRPPVVADMGADVRFACRVLARNGWATAGAILTLALAMGVANTTFISTYAALWRDFPFERPDRIAIMRTVDAHGREAGLSFADFQDWRREAGAFEGPSAAFAIGTISLGRDGAPPEQFEGLYVSADTFSVLRVKPTLGRDFLPADDRPGAEAVAIISSNIWKSRYAASGDVLGRKPLRWSRPLFRHSARRVSSRPPRCESNRDRRRAADGKEAGPRWPGLSIARLVNSSDTGRLAPSRRDRANHWKA